MRDHRASAVVALSLWLGTAQGFRLASTRLGVRAAGTPAAQVCCSHAAHGQEERRRQEEVAAARPPPLVPRRAILASGIAGAAGAVGVLPARAHCLTQACLEALPDPLADSDLPLPARAPVKPLPPAAYSKLKNGQPVCRIQLGLLQLSPKTSKGDGPAEYWEPRATAVVETMKEACDMGYTTFDLADVYGEAEDYVGSFHDTYGFPTGVSFNSKWIPTGTSAKNLSTVAAAVDKARARMKTEQLDVLQMYWWDYEKANYVEMMANAQKLLHHNPPPLTGIGVTGFDQRHLAEVVDSGVDVVSAQVSFSIVDTRPLDGSFTQFCAAKRIGVLCHGSVLGGFLWSSSLHPLSTTLNPLNPHAPHPATDGQPSTPAALNPQPNPQP